MIPLTFLNQGEDGIVKRIGGKDDVKNHLENLGFSLGAQVTVINSLNGNIIVKVKEARIAVSAELAQKIMVLN